MIHLYHDPFILLFLNDTFYIVAALEFGVVGVVIELDAHGDTLLYLYEVPVALSIGMSEKALPVASEMRSTVPV